MEGKPIKEEAVEGIKDHSPPPAADHSLTTTAATARRAKGMKSPGSPEGDTPPPPPCAGTPPVALMPSPPGASTSPPTRPSLGKLKRFLSTLVQFGSELSPELGERVRGLVLSLAAGTTNVEEFHSSLQEMTNFPLRPFVLPFLRSHLPLLQRDLTSHARLAKQTVSQYLRHHEQMVLDPTCSPTEPSEIFHSEATSEGKRKHGESIYENGKEDNGEPAAKRQNTPLLFNPLAPLSSLHPGLGQYQGLLGASLPLLGGLSGISGLTGLPHAAPPPHLLPGADLPAPARDDRSADEEWKNINTMLNCILSMVEKTKRALSILQSRDRTVTSETDLKRAANEIVRIAEDRVGEIKRRAEEAVAEVKRQAMMELERLAVRNGPAKIREEDEETTSSHHNLCWNCGRKAQETCSGCNVARYCGAVCQHRDWENHHQLCCTLDRRHNLLGNSSRVEDRRNILEERRSFAEEQTIRRHSADENRRHDAKEEKRDKDKDKEDKERRLLPGLNSALLAGLDRRNKEEGSASFASLRGGRCLRATPPVAAGVADK